MEPVIVEKTLLKSPHEIWKVLTEVAHMQRWFFEQIPAFEAVEGFEVGFDVVSDTRHFFHQWKVTAVLPFQKIAYEWRFKEYPGVSVSIFELFPKESGTRLRITSKVLKPFPTAIPEFSRESCLDGWTYFVNRIEECILEN